MDALTKKCQRLTLVLVLMGLTLSCTTNQPAGTDNDTGGLIDVTPSLFQTVTPDENPSQENDQDVAEQTPQLIASLTTIDIEMDWHDAPILPEISPRVYEIFKDGQAQSRNPHSFSVIGDCQSIPYVFLGPIGMGVLEPDSAESYLWDAINYFEMSFDHWSVTSRGGFTAASILAPIQADPHYCKPGESPLTCEYRLNNPAYVFITLETWLYPDTIHRYEEYLRAIVDYVIDKGSVPILLTKADAAEVDSGMHVINPAIVRVAHDYDIPLVNFWRAAQYLENIGIDPDRDGFHLSQEGYDLKNILALRALYLTWQAVEYGIIAGNDGQEGLPFTSTPKPGQRLQPSPVIISPDCTGGCIYFATAKSMDGNITADGIYAYNFSTQILNQVLGSGYDLQDISEDGSRLLVNFENYLYEISAIDGSTTLISDSFRYMGKQGAYWNSDDSAVVLIDQTHPLQTDEGGAISLFPSSRDGEIFFEAGACSEKDFCQHAGTYHLDTDAMTTNMIPYTHPVFSPDGTLVAYLNPDAATNENYYHIGYLLLEEPDNSALSRRVIYFPVEHGFMIYPDVREYVFSPDNDKLILIYDVYSAYFERSMDMQTYLIDLSSGILYDFGRLEGISASLDPQLVWSPEGDKILFFLADAPSEDEYTMNVYMTDLVTGVKLTLFDQSILTSEDYFYITNIYWR